MLASALSLETWQEKKEEEKEEEVETEKEEEEEETKVEEAPQAPLLVPVSLFHSSS